MIVCAASNNAGKLKELRRILERMGHEVKSLRELGIDLDPEETGTTFAENARIKARAVMEASGLPAIADDSGLCVDALQGGPGVYSARYGEPGMTQPEKNQMLLRTMQGQFPRTCHFACHITCCKKPVNRCLTIRVHPVTTGGMTTYDVRLSSLNFHVLLTWIFPGFHPLEGLSRCHV